MSVYLLEHEVGFDPALVGFPSISGCHAILLVTERGMFGYHNAGGSAQGSWAVRAAGFAQYYNEHFLRGPATRLYGVTFVATNRGYGGNAAERWRDELVQFATALNFGGKIRGYNLDLAGIVGSAYVEFRRAVDKAEIYVKRWQDADKTVGFNTDRANHKILVPRAMGTILQLENQNNQVVTNVTQANLVRVHSTRLRG